LNRNAESVKVWSYSEFSQFNVNGILGTAGWDQFVREESRSIKVQKLRAQLETRHDRKKPVKVLVTLDEYQGSFLNRSQ
jgi:hypothetical protein